MPRLVLIFLAALSLTLAGCHPRVPVSASDAVSAEGSLGNRYVPAERSSPVVARLLLEAKGSASATRPPVNLALVVDTSGSMEGRAIEDARAASKALLGALQPEDRIAVVAFGSTTEVILPSTPLEDANVAELRARLDAMRAIGTTDLAGGLRAGVAEVAGHFVFDGVNRVILLGDGDPNDAEPVKAMARDAGVRGISITTLGLGPDYNETLMGAVAQASGGTFHYVADSAAVAGFFRAEIVRLNRTYAKNATVELVPGPGVRVVSIVGQGGANGLTIPIGDLSLGEKREIVVELDAPGHRAGATVELLDAVVRFDDVRTDASTVRRIFFGARATASAKEIEAGRDATVERSLARAKAAAATLEAIEAARRGAMEQAQESLKKAKDSGYGYEFTDDPLLSGSLDSVAPSAVQIKRPSQQRNSEVVRRAHDKAMKVFQSD